MDKEWFLDVHLEPDLLQSRQWFAFLQANSQLLFLILIKLSLFLTDLGKLGLLQCIFLTDLNSCWAVFSC